MLKANSTSTEAIDASDFPDLPTWRDIIDRDSDFIEGVCWYAFANPASRAAVYDVVRIRGDAYDDGWLAALAMAHEERDRVWSDAEFNQALGEFVAAAVKANRVADVLRQVTAAASGRLIASLATAADGRIRRILEAFDEHQITDFDLRSTIHKLLVRPSRPAGQ